MANNQSTEKRIRQDSVRRERNRSARSEMRKSIKQVREAVAAGDADKAKELLPDTLSIVDSSARKKIIHRNQAARTKSRLTRAVTGLTAE